MIDHGVGISVARGYDIRRVNLDGITLELLHRPTYWAGQ
jgi:hypothetical protein